MVCKLFTLQILWLVYLITMATPLLFCLLFTHCGLHIDNTLDTVGHNNDTMLSP